MMKNFVLGFALMTGLSGLTAYASNSDEQLLAALVTIQQDLPLAMRFDDDVKLAWRGTQAAAAVYMGTLFGTLAGGMADVHPAYKLVEKAGVVITFAGMVALPMSVILYFYDKNITGQLNRAFFDSARTNPVAELKVPKNLTRFLRLPIDQQFALVRGNEEVTAFLVDLSHHLEAVRGR